MHPNSPAGTIPIRQQSYQYWHQYINQQALPFIDRAGKKQIVFLAKSSTQEEEEENRQLDHQTKGKKQQTGVQEPP